MRLKNILAIVLLSSFMMIGCKEEAKKEVKKENVSLAISGMTCEIGCAKTIQSKLSKKEGVLNAKVIFTDSIATIEYDANTVSKKDLIAFVDGIAGGGMYKASESDSKKHECLETCKKECQLKEGNKKECKENCTMACCKDKKA